MADVNILLSDLVNDFDGHFYIMRALHKINNSHFVDTKEKKILLKKHPFTGLIERIRIFRSAKKNASKYPGRTILHFLTADKIYFIPLMRNIENDNLKVVATIHRVPTSPFLIKRLKKFAKKVSSIIVLSASLEQRLKLLGIENVITIPHPTFYNYSGLSRENCRDRLGFTSDKIVISSLGGTRFDKALDLLIQAINLLPKKEQSKIILNIAGRVQDFDYEYIVHSLNKNVECKLILRSLSDEEFCSNILASDWVAVPYRKSFAGVSGPMVESLSQGIPVIVPKNSSLELFCKPFKGYVSFESENVEELSAKLSELINMPRLNVINKEILSTDAFIEAHRKLYNSIYAS